jgi:hypothetical protein
VSYNPATLIPLAETLLDEPPSIDAEARFRSAINRSYYGPLIRLKQRIELAHGRAVVPKEGTHGWIRRALTATRSPPMLKIKAELVSLGARREDADYEPDSTDYVREDAEEAIEGGRRVLRRIEAIPDSQLRNLRG